MDVKAEGTDRVELSDAWRAEIANRVEGVLAGEVELVDADETYTILSAELASKQA